MVWYNYYSVHTTLWCLVFLLIVFTYLLRMGYKALPHLIVGGILNVVVGGGFTAINYFGVFPYYGRELSSYLYYPIIRWAYNCPGSFIIIYLACYCALHILTWVVLYVGNWSFWSKELFEVRKLNPELGEGKFEQWVVFMFLQPFTLYLFLLSLPLALLCHLFWIGGVGFASILFWL